MARIYNNRPGRLRMHVYGGPNSKGTKLATVETTPFNKQSWTKWLRFLPGVQSGVPAGIDITVFPGQGQGQGQGKGKGKGEGEQSQTQAPEPKRIEIRQRHFSFTVPVPEDGNGSGHGNGNYNGNGPAGPPPPPFRL